MDGLDIFAMTKDLVEFMKANGFDAAMKRARDKWNVSNSLAKELEDTLLRLPDYRHPMDKDRRP